MHPGVGPSGPVDRLAHPRRQAGQRGLELSLDRPGSRLDLEAGEVRAVVFDPWRGTARAGSGDVAPSRAPCGRRLDELELDDRRRVAGAGPSLTIRV